MASSAGSVVVILVSGGIDSTVLLSYLIDKGLPVCPLFINYGQRSAKCESLSFTNSCNRLSTPQRIHIDVPGISRLTRNQLTSQYSKDPWFPMRNSLLVDLAALHAQSIGSNTVAIGLTEGPTFPDTSELFIRKATQAISLSLGTPFQVVAPFRSLRKSEVVSLASGLNVRLSDTYSCFIGEPNHCGSCQGCISRKDAFRLASVSDTTGYSSQT
jgi:7-cyano-7-deazaguanine synthase